MKHCLFLFGIIILVGCKSSTTGYSNPFNRNDSLTTICSFLTEVNSEFWKRDSLGMNGFRDLFSEKMVKNNCILGANWNQVGIFFGKSYSQHEEVRNNKQIVKIRYVAYHSPIETFSYSYSMLLEFIIDKQEMKVIKLQYFYPENG